MSRSINQPEPAIDKAAVARLLRLPVDQLDQDLYRQAASACSAYSRNKPSDTFWDAMANMNQIPDNLSPSMRLAAVYAYLEEGC